MWFLRRLFRILWTEKNINIEILITLAFSRSHIRAVSKRFCDMISGKCRLIWENVGLCGKTKVYMGKCRLIKENVDI